MFEFPSLRSLSAIPIHYRISWEARGLLSRPSGVVSQGSKERDLVNGGMPGGESAGKSAVVFCAALLLAATATWTS